MAIERDIKTIKQRQKTSKTKMVQEIKSLAKRQTIHERANNKQFQAITVAIGLLPTQDVITKTIQDTIKVVVNGKIDGIKNDVAEVKNHLTDQDNAIKTMSDKIKPVVGGLAWLDDLVRVVSYIGGLAIAIAGIFELLKIIKVIN